MEVTVISKTEFLTGDIEKYGTGFKRLREWFLEYPELALDIFDLDGMIQVTVSSKKKVGEKVGEKLTKNQVEIINQIRKNNNISAKELSLLVGISDRKIEENIAKLKEKNMLKRVGAARGGYWMIIE